MQPREPSPRAGDSFPRALAGGAARADAEDRWAAEAPAPVAGGLAKALQSRALPIAIFALAGAMLLAICLAVAVIGRARPPFAPKAGAGAPASRLVGQTGGAMREQTVNDADRSAEPEK
jgi:hypothetical protein